jgi:hypothetical protein
MRHPQPGFLRFVVALAVRYQRDRYVSLLQLRLKIFNTVLVESDRFDIEHLERSDIRSATKPYFTALPGVV